jgi:uncharacterized repeat protein (TIGR01451 family)
MPALPGSLVNFNCFHNQITSLPALPDSIQIMQCDSNQFANLPALPLKLKELHCAYNQITSFPPLPNDVYELYCQYNKLTSLPSLPNNLWRFDCSYNLLTNLPVLPTNLAYFDCNNNLLTSMPNLPTAYFTGLACNNNHLSELPTLPATITYLICNDNQLTTLPDLPDMLYWLNCSNNLIACLPPIPHVFHWNELNLSGNPFTCLPNYVTGMSNALLNMPLCVNGDTANNHYNCSGFEGVAGNIYKDNNTNCSLDNGEPRLENIHLSLYDSTNSLVGQTYSFSSGAYIFPATAGTYTVRIDTAGMPYKINCANTNIDSTVILTTANPSVINVNYPVNCKPVFDVGVQSIVSNGFVFPGQPHKLLITAGDMSQWNNLDCSAGISGQVQVTITGPFTYQGVVPGALTPTVAGNVYTYNIADFGTIDNTTAFGMKFLTDTSAQLNDVICVEVIVTPSAGDINPANNIYNYCYSVLNSMDPNMKETYPAKVLPGYSDYLTYTVHFQNTGTASAINIRIVDTLSANLDLATFQVINSSHTNSVTLNGNILTVRFPNIMLPDSFANSDASKGFVQYRIKPLSGITEGTEITNTAWIYFDYNAPIATNTTVNLFDVTGISEKSEQASRLTVYPNPVNDQTNILYSIENKSLVNIAVYNFMGTLVTTIRNEQQPAGNYKKVFNAKEYGLSAGIYFVRLSVNGKSEVKKLVVIN